MILDFDRCCFYRSRGFGEHGSRGASTTGPSSPLSSSFSRVFLSFSSARWRFSASFSAFSLPSPLSRRPSQPSAQLLSFFGLFLFALLLLAVFLLQPLISPRALLRCSALAFFVPLSPCLLAVSAAARDFFSSSVRRFRFFVGGCPALEAGGRILLPLNSSAASAIARLLYTMEVRIWRGESTLHRAASSSIERRSALSWGGVRCEQVLL